MADRRRRGKSKRAGEDPARFEEERAARTLLFSSFLPSDERKNPDWSNLMNYLLAQRIDCIVADYCNS